MRSNRLLFFIFALAIASAGVANFADEEGVPAFPDQEAISKNSREWQAPNYEDQKALGYGEKYPFEVLPGLEERVNFWIKIYSKYSTDEGVLHDQENIGVIYEALQFKDINSQNISEKQKSKLRRDRIKEAKKKLSLKLAHFQRLDDPSSLPDEDLRLYKLFDGNNEKLKFAKASQLNRIRFQLGQSDRFLQGVYYSGRYIHEMERIFKNEGLPIELTRLPFVESSFNIFARSRVGASGIWQIMPRTGRELRLRVDTRVDERNDVWKATAAAAKLLKSNYQFLGEWPLALTAYNHGPYGVKKISERLKTKDIVKIISDGEGRRFGFASMNFYACFLAALEVEKNAIQYFDGPLWSHEIPLVELPLASELPWSQLLIWFQGNGEETRLYNSHLAYRVRQGTAKIPSGTFIRVPESQRAVASNFLKTVPTAQVVAQDKERTYRVHRGDTLGGIARKFQVSLDDLKLLNSISNHRNLRVGQKLLIPD